MAEQGAPKKSTVTKEDGYAVIRMPLERVHGLRVALRPVRVGETTSAATQKLRDSLDKALARLEVPS